MSGDPPVLRWPRSDGDPSRWPPHDAGNGTWNDKQASDSPKVKLYQQKVGEHFATKYNYPGASKFMLQLPSGYAIFTHCKPQPDKSIREDAYLFGSTTTTKFRSPAEFIPHAEWLMDTSLPLSDHSKCLCKYSGNGPRRQSTSNAGSPAKRSLDSPRPGGSSKRSKQEIHEVEPEPQPSSIVPERAGDLRSGRRYRKGELIFFRLTTVIRPPDGRGLYSITHWPGLIAQIKFKTLTKQLPNGAAPAASTSNPVPQVLHTWEYQVRPLGMMNTGCDVVKDLKDLLPWALGNELLGGQDGWAAIGKDALRVMKEGVEKELEEVKEKGKEQALGPLEDGKLSSKVMDGRWRRRWAERIKFTEMSINWEVVVFRLAVALKTGRAITNSWTQTDKIELAGMIGILPEEDRKAIEAQEKTLYQGLWLGGERLWVDDVIRLRKRRDGLPSDTLLPPSEVSKDKAVFLKIDSISVEVASDKAPQKDDKNGTAWRCLLYGDAFELASTPEGSIKSYPGTTSAVMRPPKGFYYHQINPGGFEVTVDVNDVAGRVYPDLCENSTWLKDPDSTDNDEQKHAPGDTALALMGLRPGDLVAANSEKWKEDLYVIVSEATRSTEKEMRDYYVRLLSEGISLLPDDKIGQKGQSSDSGFREVVPPTPDSALSLDQTIQQNGSGSIESSGGVMV